jgi:hypothetical protein
VKISGHHTLKCAIKGRPESGTKIGYEWKQLPRWGQPKPLAEGSHYKVRKADAGHRLACFANASNDGGTIVAGTDSVLIAQ